jgi:hypothetical protein
VSPRWLSAAALAQDDTLKRVRTCGYVNGRYWKDEGQAELSRMSYLVGVMDMAAHENVWLSVYQVYKVTPQAAIWPKGATLGEVKESVNEFYQDPANLQIPIIDTISLIKYRLEGHGPKDIEEWIRSERKSASEPCLFFAEPHRE